MRNFFLTTVLLLGAANTAHAFNPQPDPPGFGLIGIAHEQSAIVSVINTGSTTCSVTLRVLDAEGDVIAAQTQAVAPGDHAALAIAGNDIVPADATRALVRATVTNANDPTVPPDPCMPSFSIRDAAGTTFATARFARARSTRSFTAPVMAGTNLRAQLVLVNAGTGVCQATLSFRAPGNRTVASRTVTVAAGDHAILDTSGGTTPVWGQAIVAEDPATPGHPPDPCMVSFGVYNRTSGATLVGGALSGE